MTDRRSRRLVGIVFAVALAAGAPAACAREATEPPGGGTSVPGATESPPPGATPTPTNPPTTPPAVRPSSPGTEGPTLTITGTVEAGVESGCLVLTADGTTYELLGARDLVRVGDVVTLDGVLARDIATTCQQGTPFRVRAVRPG